MLGILFCIFVASLSAAADKDHFGKEFRMLFAINASFVGAMLLLAMNVVSFSHWLLSHWKL